MGYTHWLYLNFKISSELPKTSHLFISITGEQKSIAVDDIAVWLGRLTANAKIATVLDSIPASSDKAEPEGRQMNQC